MEYDRDPANRSIFTQKNNDPHINPSAQMHSNSAIQKKNCLSPSVSDMPRKK